MAVLIMYSRTSTIAGYGSQFQNFRFFCHLRRDRALPITNGSVHAIIKGFILGPAQKQVHKCEAKETDGSLIHHRTPVLEFPKNKADMRL